MHPQENFEFLDLLRSFLVQSWYKIARFEQPTAFVIEDLQALLHFALRSDCTTAHAL